MEPTSDIEAGADHLEDPQVEDIMQTSDNLIAENSEDSHQIMQTHTAMHAMGELLLSFHVHAAKARSIFRRNGFWVSRGSLWVCLKTAA